MQTQYPDVMEKVAQSLLEKTAKKKHQPSPSWLDRQRGVTRATRSSSSGLGQFVVPPELLGERMKRSFSGMGIGALAGGALGAATGSGGAAASGALVGALVGNLAGAESANKKWLAQRGIKSLYMGLDYDYSPAAVRKYIRRTDASGYS